MSVSEPERHELYQAFEGLMGKKKAETMMALLPPTGWGDVATRRDLEAHELVTKRQLEAHEAAVKQQLEAHEAAVKQQLEAHEATVKQQFEIVNKNIELTKSDLNERIMRTALMVNLPTVLAAVGLSFAATRL
jgi:hypothetical protein